MIWRYGEAMAVLVDAARWPWRGTTWCHLVSDESFEELHTFAALLGCRRVGFQGDHYDIDVDTRPLALELGAVACDSRELVRRMRGAGLRVRPSNFEKWTLVERGDGVISEDVLARLTGSRSTLGDAGERARDFLRAEPVGVMEGWFALERADAGAVIFHGVESDSNLSTLEAPEQGRFVRPLRQGTKSTWSVEFISPPPESHQ